MLSILLSSIVIFLFSINLFLPSSVWSVLPDDEDDHRIINFRNNDASLRGGTSTTYEPEKNVKVGGIETTNTIIGTNHGDLLIGSNMKESHSR